MLGRGFPSWGPRFPLVFAHTCTSRLKEAWGWGPDSFDNSKGECDFLAWKNGELYAFQVCYELTDYNRTREYNGFSTVLATIKKKTIITYNQKEQKDDIYIIPLWEWALSD